VSTVTERHSSIQYSAEAEGSHGSLRCHVVRGELNRDRRAQYSIVVCNETDIDAHSVAFVPYEDDGRPRTLVQTIVGPSSDFAATVVLDVGASGGVPELRVALSSGETQFTLVVPSIPAEATPALAASRSIALPATAPVSGPSAAPRLVNPAIRDAKPFTASSSALSTHESTAAERTAVSLVRSSRAALTLARSGMSPAFTATVIGLVAVFGIVGLFVARPQIAEFNVPHSAAPGSAVAVLYRAYAGSGSAVYAVLGPNRQLVASGPVPLGSGHFAFTLPKAAQPQDGYLVRLRVENAFGSATAEQVVQAPPAPPKPAPPPVAAKRLAPPPRAADRQGPPQIRSLALDRSTLTSGETLTVYYDVGAANGSIALYDPGSQITYGRADLSSSGHSTFVAPRVETQRFLTVVATARRGSATTQSRIGVTVTPANGAGPAPADAPDAEGETAGEAPTNAVAQSAIYTRPRVHAGHQIEVATRGSHDLHIVLLDEKGHELAKHDVPSGDHLIYFRAPVVSAPTRLLFQASYPNGVGSESIVRAVSVVP
jgi:hypothetical protein